MTRYLPLDCLSLAYADVGVLVTGIASRAAGEECKDLAARRAAGCTARRDSIMVADESSGGVDDVEERAGEGGQRRKFLSAAVFFPLVPGLIRIQSGAWAQARPKTVARALIFLGEGKKRCLALVLFPPRSHPSLQPCLCPRPSTMSALRSLVRPAVNLSRQVQTARASPKVLLPASSQLIAHASTLSAPRATGLKVGVRRVQLMGMY